MEIWTPEGMVMTKTWKSLQVRMKDTGEIRFIKDFRFNKEIHEAIGEVEEKKTLDEIVKETKEDMKTKKLSAQFTPRAELEAVARVKGFTEEQISACSNKKSLLILIESV
jgi:putative NIF3 family GTP cyclohydrolase 1 type 2